MPKARHLIQELYPEIELELLYVVQLLVSEAATNAVLHAGGEVFELVCHSPLDGSVEIEVHDGSRDRPQRRSPSPTDQHGRGLKLLDRYAPGWTVEETSNGKRLKFTVEGKRCQAEAASA
ncbi:ATP-binding protein [Streptomyces hygroscopicus]|uniref:ATP-binding protein n=1 Tax=Streptomyces hygroscopicus TaxID=1912 RepID=UPI001F5BCC88|nr:ATP-binding protein [Streptomyces sp. NBRC 109436]